MNYNEASPKVLKFLVSDGDLVDDNGNVIAHSDSLQDMYIKASPQVKKYLLSDGSVVDEDNNLIIKNDYFKKVYDQAEPKPAKYLHADGTIDENPGSGGGGSDLENNHQATIDVSTYTDPVEINPAQGKEGMKKATITLENIPSGGSVTAYPWRVGGVIGNNLLYLNINIAPSTFPIEGIKAVSVDENMNLIAGNLIPEGIILTYTYVSDTEFTLTESNNTTHFTRDTQVNDLHIW